MKISICALYCKHVIDVLSDMLKKLDSYEQDCNDLEEKLFESYIVLEKLLQYEIN